jgi:uncharacterized cupin superfamily protein
MSIHILKNTATLANLEDWGAVPTALSDPAPTLRGIEKIVPGIPVTDTGVWECTPGKFSRSIAGAEIMHFLAGECEFTPTDGETIRISAGDTVFFPANTFGVWNVRSTVRKLYVII